MNNGTGALERLKSSSPKKMKSMMDSHLKVETKAAFGDTGGMLKSGPAGGTPMVSRSGKQTVAQYLCFSNGIKQKEFVANDPMDFTNKPVEEIKERLRRELAIVDPDSNRASQIRGELEGFDASKIIFGKDGTTGMRRGSHGEMKGGK